MTEKTYITSDNIATFAKVQSAAGFADRGDVILAWDELNGKQKKLAKNIDIDGLQIRTSDPRSVPNKWSENIVEEDSEPEAVDFIKQIIANPARFDVYEMLKTYNPPEPLMLWWIDKCFTDQDYFEVLADACRYGLFRGDNKYLWSVIAFGVGSGEGRFRWASNDDESATEKAVKKRVLEQHDIRPKELEVLWDDVKPFVHEWVEIDSEEADDLGIVVDANPGGTEDVGSESNDDESGNASSLLDF